MNTDAGLCFNHRCMYTEEIPELLHLYTTPMSCHYQPWSYNDGYNSDFCRPRTETNTDKMRPQSFCTMMCITCFYLVRPQYFSKIHLPLADRGYAYVYVVKLYVYRKCIKFTFTPDMLAFFELVSGVTR